MLSCPPALEIGLKHHLLRLFMPPSLELSGVLDPLLSVKPFDDGLLNKAGLANTSSFAIILETRARSHGDLQSI
jgi:hypothetical protein